MSYYDLLLNRIEAPAYREQLPEAARLGLDAGQGTTAQDKLKAIQQAAFYANTVDVAPAFYAPLTGLPSNRVAAVLEAHKLYETLDGDLDAATDPNVPNNLTLKDHLALKAYQKAHGLEPLGYLPNGGIDPVTQYQLATDSVNLSLMKARFPEMRSGHYSAGQNEHLRSTLRELGHGEKLDQNNGKYNKSVTAAVKDFQKANGLAETGNVDAQTSHYLWAHTILNRQIAAAEKLMPEAAPSAASIPDATPEPLPQLITEAVPANALRDGRGNVVTTSDGSPVLTGGGAPLASTAEPSATTQEETQNPLRRLWNWLSERTPTQNQVESAFNTGAAMANDAATSGAKLIRNNTPDAVVTGADRLSNALSAGWKGLQQGFSAPTEPAAAPIDTKPPITREKHTRITPTQ